MPQLAAVLKGEIERLSRKALRHQIEPLRKATTRSRAEIAGLKREIAVLRRRLVTSEKSARNVNKDDSALPTGVRQRFVAKGLKSLRSRLGLSAPRLAQLIGVSEQSVYNWEQKKSVPRAEQLAKIAALRALGKREVAAKLQVLDRASD